MKVRDAMSRSVRSVTPDMKVMEVASLMTLYRFHGLPVVDAEDKLVGIIAEKDVLHTLFPKLDDLMIDGMHSVDLDKEMARYGDVLNQTVEELMTKNPLSVDPDMHLLRAATIMVRHKFRRIPIVEDAKLAGVLSLGDVHKAIFHANISGKLKSV